MNLNRLFNPRSIAIYGVSSNPEKIGSTIFFNLISSEFKGELYPINPNHARVMGHECYKSIAEIKKKVDLAIMAVPSDNIHSVLEDCHKSEVKSLVVISSGFSEAGPEGKILEEKMIFTAKKYGIEILGPNCLGLLVGSSKMNASFSSSNIEEGGIALISQSGAVCTAFIDQANNQNVGFSHLVSVGNKSMINENHLLEYFLKDEKVRVVGAYLEEFSSGKIFSTLKNELKIEKPIVVMTPGQTEAAQSAMKSHTGSLASPYKMIHASLKKYGIVQTTELAQMFSLINGFDWINTLPKGKRVGIVTNAGGMGILATDALVDSGLEIAKLSHDTLDKLSSVLPESAHKGNPIDVVGDAKADRYQKSLEILMESDEVDSIFLILSPQLVTEIEDTAKLISTMSKNNIKPIIPVFLGGEYVEAGIKRLHNNKILCFSDLNLAVYTLDKITEYAEYLEGQNKHKNENQTKGKKQGKIDLSKYTNVEPTPLPEEIVIELMKKFGVEIPSTIVVDSIEEGLLAAKKIGFPVVIKATSEDILHKTDVKAIFLNIQNEKEFIERSNVLYRSILQSTKKQSASYIVQEQFKGDLEVFIGVKKDKGFGHMILFGSGGIYTEVYKDIVEDVMPMNVSDIEKLINSTKISKIINGTRGKDKLAIREIIKTIEKIQDLVSTYPEIYEIDINPGMLTNTRFKLADVKILAKKE